LGSVRSISSLLVDLHFDYRERECVEEELHERTNVLTNEEEKIEQRRPR